MRKKVEQLGPIENDPEYQLIVEVRRTPYYRRDDHFPCLQLLNLFSLQANNLAAEIDQEQIEIHKFGKDVYTKRFPELETLVVMVSEVEVMSNDLSLMLSF